MFIDNNLCVLIQVVGSLGTGPDLIVKQTHGGMELAVFWNWARSDRERGTRRNGAGSVLELGEI